MDGKIPKPFFIARTDLQRAVRAAVAAWLAIGVAQLMSFPYPIYALISAVIVTDLDPVQTRRLGVPRMAGTVLGTVLGAAISSFFPVGVTTIALGILTAMLLTQLLRLPRAAQVAGYVCGIALLDHGDNPWSYALLRMLETLLGIIAAILVSLVPKLLPPEKQGDSSEDGAGQAGKPGSGGPGAGAGD